MYIFGTFPCPAQKRDSEGMLQTRLCPLFLFTQRLAVVLGLIGSFGDILCSTHAARTDLFFINSVLHQQHNSLEHAQLEYSALETVGMPTAGCIEVRDFQLVAQKSSLRNCHKLSHLYKIQCYKIPALFFTMKRSQLELRSLSHQIVM